MQQTSGTASRLAQATATQASQIQSKILRKCGYYVGHLD